ncbi:histidine kinase [Streptomyces sp. V4-01]|uniref:histidine kinase n=1 Tax=Actinacidiphila polyblastidii TaxID=3110430 RepID=A0ABU7P9Y7_9ACTN|nr:histidine kinase [Streptomyces sp. V4-01]
MRLLYGHRARLRWVHLILGGALLMPFFLVASVFVPTFTGGGSVFESLPAQIAAFGCALPLAAAAALLPLARPLSVIGARSLGGVDPALLADAPARSWAARVRTSVWFVLHVGLGGLVGICALALPRLALVLIVVRTPARLRGSRPPLPRAFHGWRVLLAPPAGITLLLALSAGAAVAGALLARTAPALLGPTPADRLAAVEARAADLAARSRLARELHDSIGHTLSAVTLQAGAAARILDSDREFVRGALTSIEEATRRTVGELDSVLGLLRQDGEQPGSSTGPTLDALGGLLAHSGAPVAYTVSGVPGRAPDPVSRAAYRIVQEGLSNALRHGGTEPVRLHIAWEDTALTITMLNSLVDGADGADRAKTGEPARPLRGAGAGGGRGLRGIGERAALLDGRAHAGPDDGRWRLTVRLPLPGGAR